MNKALTIIGAFLLMAGLVSCGGNGDLPGGSGLIEATDAVVSAETSGRIEALYVDEGDVVVRGDTLALIDTLTLALQMRQARAFRETVTARRENDRITIEKATANLGLAQKEFDRIESLVASGSANRQQYDNAENALTQARLAVKSARAALRMSDSESARADAEIALLDKRLTDCHPLSPLSGIVIATYIGAGELAAPGRALLKIARLDTVEVKIYLPPRHLTGIKLGDQASVDPEDGRDAPLSGRVTWIASEAEFTPKNVQTKQARADLVYAVKITIPNPDQTLKIGMPVAVTIP